MHASIQQTRQMPRISSRLNSINCPFIKNSHRASLPAPVTFKPPEYLNKNKLGGNRPNSSTRHHRSRGALSCRAAANTPQNSSGPAASILKFFDANFISLGLLSAIALGWLFPGPGTFAAAHNLQFFSTVGIFTVSGILLQRGEALAALRSPLALAYGVASILFLTPLAAFACLRLPLDPPAMALGLAVFCCVPTTLSTCVTLTNACAGNSAVALLLVVVTNVLGVFTLPATLGWVLGAAGKSMAFDQRALFVSLVKTVLLPLLFGVALQVGVPGLSQWRQTNRKLLSYVSTGLLCFVPWMQLSLASSQKLPLSPKSVLAAAAAGAALHVVYLALNSVFINAVRFSATEPENAAIRKALVLCCSEKTLPIAVAVVGQLAAASGAAAGMAVVPCVAGHLVQIAIDSALVGRWNKRDQEAALKLAAA